MDASSIWIIMLLFMGPCINGLAEDEVGIYNILEHGREELVDDGWESPFMDEFCDSSVEASNLRWPHPKPRPPHPGPIRPTFPTFNVTAFGAKGDGVTDDSKAFLDAWEFACQVNHSRLIVPSGQSYLLAPTKFSGPCIRMTLEIDGTILAPLNPLNWTNDTRFWLVFQNLDGFTIEGNGTIDGQGQQWWAESCKVNSSNPCHIAPTAITVFKCNNITVRDLNIQDSQQMHLQFDKCNGVRAIGLNINAPYNSPNTDGIHLHESIRVLIQNCSIATGDDCVSVQTLTFNVRMKNITCGPGHGISIGGLGKDGSYANVSAVVVDGAVLNGTTNGLRIKTWQGGQGRAYGFRYQNVQMINVTNPILIDQYYCDSATPCQNQTSAVQVMGVLYRNITGTSSSHVAVRFACSDSVPCEHIVLEDVSLTHKSGSDALSFCESATGFSLGDIVPQSCLTKFGKI